MDLSAPQASTRETRYGKLCTEHHEFSIPYEQFVKLADAKKAYVTLGLKNLS
jgi:hypothetical protein